MARCSFFGCFSAAPFVVFGGNSFPATSLYSAWITKREKSGHFQFSKSDRLMLMTNLLGQKPASGKRPTKRLSTVICPNMFKAETFSR